MIHRASIPMVLERIDQLRERAEELLPPQQIAFVLTSRGHWRICTRTIFPLPTFVLPNQHLPPQTLIEPPGTCVLIFWEHGQNHVFPTSQPMPCDCLPH